MHSFTIGHAGAVGQAVERPGRAHRGWALVRRGNAAESTTGSIKDTPACMPSPRGGPRRPTYESPAVGACVLTPILFSRAGPRSECST